MNAAKAGEGVLADVYKLVTAVRDAEETTVAYWRNTMRALLRTVKISYGGRNTN